MEVFKVDSKLCGGLLSFLLGNLSVVSGSRGLELDREDGVTEGLNFVLGSRECVNELSGSSGCVEGVLMFRVKEFSDLFPILKGGFEGQCSKVCVSFSLLEPLNEFLELFWCGVVRENLLVLFDGSGGFLKVRVETLAFVFFKLERGFEFFDGWRVVALARRGTVLGKAVVLILELLFLLKELGKLEEDLGWEGGDNFLEAFLIGLEFRVLGWVFFVGFVPISEGVVVCEVLVKQVVLFFWGFLKKGHRVFE